MPLSTITLTRFILIAFATSLVFFINFYFIILYWNPNFSPHGDIDTDEEIVISLFEAIMANLRFEYRMYAEIC